MKKEKLEIIEQSLYNAPEMCVLEINIRRALCDASPEECDTEDYDPEKL